MYFYRLSSFLCCFSFVSFAQSTEFTHALTTPIQAQIRVQETEIAIQLQHYVIPNKAKKTLAERAFFSTPFQTVFLGQAQQLGMNDVPVLNQGPFGSCVTFANIGAIDALLSPEEYISEWCNLTLGEYFEENSKNYPSGWNGSFGEIVLNQMLYMGVIPKRDESMIECGHASSYLLAGTKKSAMSLTEFNTYSQPLENVTWNSILNYMDGLYFKEKEMNGVLNDVKKTLMAKDRMTLGFLIDDAHLFLGIEGQHMVPNDTWVMTPEIEQHLAEGRIDAGHEVIITGFDDDAVVYDKKGGPHQGVFTLRNSWGVQAGNHGDYYMTYDYFLKMAVEVQRITRFEKY